MGTNAIVETNQRDCVLSLIGFGGMKHIINDKGGPVDPDSTFATWWCPNATAAAMKKTATHTTETH